MLISKSIKKLHQVVAVCLVCFLFLSCEDDTPNYNVELDFQEYVDRFIEEAAKRGKTIDFSDTGLSIQFREAVDTESGGVCYLGQHRIEIEKFFWDDSNDAQREGLIFHELGHCELDRLHRNDLLPNGEWASRMRGDPIPEPQTIPINYSGTRQQYYTDELFDENTPLPDWASWTFAYDEVPDSNRTVLTYVPETVREFREALRTSFSSDFELEVEVKLGASEKWVGMQWGGLEGKGSIVLVYRGSKRFYIGSGNDIYGPMREIPTLELLRGAEEFNKITLRKIGDIYRVFVNEEFIYWFDYAIPATTDFTSFISGQTKPEYRNIRLSKISP